ncbi:MAG: hypothetical protein ACWA44_02075 [Thiotrichales bacterium]
MFGRLACFCLANRKEGAERQRDVEGIVRAQAKKKAHHLVRRASADMALEKQALPTEQNKEEIAGLRDELMRDMPSNFWEDK